jgi:hypothetical protein
MPEVCKTINNWRMRYLFEEKKKMGKLKQQLKK